MKKLTGTIRIAFWVGSLFLWILKRIFWRSKRIFWWSKSWSERMRWIQKYFGCVCTDCPSTHRWSFSEQWGLTICWSVRWWWFVIWSGAICSRRYTVIILRGRRVTVKVIGHHKSIPWINKRFIIVGKWNRVLWCNSDMSSFFIVIVTGCRRMINSNSWYCSGRCCLRRTCNWGRGWRSINGCGSQIFEINALCSYS